MTKTLFIITGLSGAGLSSTLKILEDADADVFDNFPLNFLPQLLKENRSGFMAVGIDARTPNFNAHDILEMAERLKSDVGWQIKTVFLTADDVVLLKRFIDTRRKHPLAKDRFIEDGIVSEKALLSLLRNSADIVIDTSEFSIHDLRHHIENHLGAILEKRLNIAVMSFAYGRGLPRQADIVFDMRFLRNPHWIPELKDLTGRSEAVQKYIEGDEKFQPFANSLKTIFKTAIPGYADSGKYFLTIAFGCTGGKHRSVTMAEKTKTWLEESGYQVAVHHRELKI